MTPAQHTAAPTWADVQQDFPLLTSISPRPIFLDSAASAQKPAAVLNVMDVFQKQHYANIHRGLYTLSSQATEMYENARRTVAQFINARDAAEIIFTRNTTEGINLIAQTYGRQSLRKGDAIMLSALEHHANIVPWQMLQKEYELEIIVVPLENDRITLNQVQKHWKPNVRIVSFSQLSNVLGTYAELATIIPFVRQVAPDALVVVDGSQGIVHAQQDMQILDADFYVFTGHKLYGPTGIGVVYGKKDTLANLAPWQGGGDMIEHVSWTGTTFAPPPARFEAGTPNIVGAIGLAAAMDYLSAITYPQIHAWESQLRDLWLTLHDAATQTPQNATKCHTIQRFATPDIALFTFNLGTHHPADVATLLNQFHISVRAGHHCCMPLMETLGISGAVRASFSIYNTLEDVHALFAALKQCDALLS